jgi:hypothetical protein
MIVVADTSPLNYLIRLGRPDVLREIYGRVLVPHAVLMEMQHPEAPAEVRAWASAAPAWLEAMQVRQLDASLAAELGAGEREAISLALESMPTFFLSMRELAGERPKFGILKWRVLSPFCCKRPCADTLILQKLWHNFASMASELLRPSKR